MKAASGVMTSRATVLIVDDNQAWRQVMASRLREDYGVLVAADGSEALEALGSERIDVIVSDVEMPEVDGTEFAVAAVSERSAAGDVPAEAPPIIVVSGLDLDDLRLQVLENVPGIAGIFQKPVDLETLHAAVKCTLEGDLESVQVLARSARDAC